MRREVETIQDRLARIAAEMDMVAAELAALDPRSPAPQLLRRWRTEIALVVSRL